MKLIATTGQELLTTEIRYFGHDCLSICDQNCGKAWGHTQRSKIALGSEDDYDDVVWLADNELGEAPQDPGSYEGGHGKPFRPAVHNKWCVRECERSNIVKKSEPITCPDWSQRLYNEPKKHDMTNAELTTGTEFS